MTPLSCVCLYILCFQFCHWPLEGDVPGVQLGGDHRGRQPGGDLLVAGLRRPQKTQPKGGATDGPGLPLSRWERRQRRDAQGLAEHQLPVMVDLHHLRTGVCQTRKRKIRKSNFSGGKKKKKRRRSKVHMCIMQQVFIELKGLKWCLETADNVSGW